MIKDRKAVEARFKKMLDYAEEISGDKEIFMDDIKILCCDFDSYGSIFIENEFDDMMTIHAWNDNTSDTIDLNCVPLDQDAWQHYAKVGFNDIKEMYKNW